MGGLSSASKSRIFRFGCRPAWFKSIPLRWHLPMTMLRVIGTPNSAVRLLATSEDDNFIAARARSLSSFASVHVIPISHRTGFIGRHIVLGHVIGLVAAPQGIVKVTADLPLFR